MTPSRRLAIAVGLMLVMLAGAVAWIGSWMLERRQLARDAGDDLATCRRLVTEIESLRQKPTLAVTEGTDVRELGEKIQAASLQAGLAETSIQGVLPQLPRQVGESHYAQKPTALTLRSVSLPQLAAFLYHLTDEPGLTVRDLRVRSPQGDTAQGAWDAEVTVMYLVYSPASKARPGS